MRNNNYLTNCYCSGIHETKSLLVWNPYPLINVHGRFSGPPLRFRQIIALMSMSFHVSREQPLTASDVFPMTIDIHISRNNLTVGWKIERSTLWEGKSCSEKKTTIASFYFGKVTVVIKFKRQVFGPAKIHGDQIRRLETTYPVEGIQRFSEFLSIKNCGLYKPSCGSKLDGGRFGVHFFVEHPVKAVSKLVGLHICT